MDPWTRKVGFPVISMAVGDDGDTVTAKQQRFLATGPDPSDASVWPIPLAAIGAGGAAVGEQYLSEASGATGISLSSVGGWVKANSGINGIFRVSYDDVLLAKLCTAGAAGEPAPVTTLSAQDRMGLVSDAFALAQSGFADTVAALKMLSSYQGDMSRIVVVAIAEGFGALQSIMFQEPVEVRAGLKRFGLKLFAPLAAKLGWNPTDSDSHESALLRPLVLRWAGALGDEAVFAECHDRFVKYIAGDASAIHPDLRHAVFSTVLKKGGQHEFDALVKLYADADAADQKVIILRSLGAASDRAVMQAVIDFTMTGDAVRDQDIYIPIAYLASNTAGRDFCYQWFCKNFESLHDRFYKGSFLFGRIISSVCSKFATYERADEIEKMFDDCKLELTSVKRAISQAIEGVRVNARWLESCKEGVSTFVADQ